MMSLCLPAVIVPLAFWTPGPTEMLLIGVIALLLYGGKLPEVAREWGKTFNEFRRSLNSVRTDLNDALHTEPDVPGRLEYHPSFRDDPVYDDETYDGETYDQPDGNGSNESESPEVSDASADAGDGDVVAESDASVTRVAEAGDGSSPSEAEGAAETDSGVASGSDADVTDPNDVDTAQRRAD